jgi:hypothetical protein
MLFRILRMPSYITAMRSALLFTVLLLPATTPAQQEDRWYTVQLLIFKHLRPENFASESWPAEWILPATDGSVDLSNISRDRVTDFSQLDSRQHSLAGDFDKLKNSSRYEPLLHLAWKQRGLDSDTAVGVRVRTGKRFTPLSPLNRHKAGNDGLRFGIFEPITDGDGYIRQMAVRRYTNATADSNATLAELEGTVKIVLGRYLHIYTDLLLLQPVNVIEENLKDSTVVIDSGIIAQPTYRIEWPGAAQADQANQTAQTEQGQHSLHGFNIKAHRRMRSGEVHHLDHPLLGVLVKVDPVGERR